VSARAGYALRAAAELAAAPGRLLPAGQLAGAQQIPAGPLEAVLTQLRRSNIVRLTRGPDGGFRLARPAAEISLAAVIRAVDGELPAARGGFPQDAAYPGPAEPLRRAWIAVGAFGPSVLETLTLADIVSGELW
jgi:Rrf2 family protein